MKWFIVVLPLVLFGGYARPQGAKQKAKASSPSTDPLLLDLARPTSQPLRMVSSTDPKGGNEDYVTLKPRQTAEVAKLTGPITVLRVWCTADPFEQLSMSAVLDGKTIAMVKQGKSAGFPQQRELGEVHEKCFYTYAPLVVKKSFKLVATNHGERSGKFFHQVNYRDGATAFAAGATPDMPQLIQMNKSMDAVVPYGPAEEIRPGKALSIGAKGPSVTRGFAVRLDGVSDELLSRIVVEIVSEGEIVPPLSVPLSSLFAQNYSRQSFTSLFLSRSGNDFIFHFAIPHKNALTIHVKNQSAKRVKMSGSLFVPTTGEPLPPYRLCAKEVTLKSQKGKYLELLDVKGAGNLVGLTFACAVPPPLRNFAMLEGDEHIEVDDDPKLTLHGTGAEDFFNSSWYFPDKLFSRPFHGLTHKSTPPAKVSCYRWMVTDRVPFKKHLRFLFEHGGRNNTEGVQYRAVVFWYQRP